MDQSVASGVRFYRERVGDLWPELMPLLVEHHAEIAHYPDIALDPDKRVYESRQAAGTLRCFTAREFGTLVGYAGFFVGASHKYRESVQATQDVIFLRPEYRGRAGLQFIRWCEGELVADGMQVVYQHVKAAHDRFGRVLVHEGYELIDLIYGKRLERA